MTSAIQTTPRMPSDLYVDDQTTKPQPWNPRPYMVDSVEWLVTHGSAALFLDPGLGKTAITLKAVTVLKKAGVVDRVLVIAPLRVCTLVWPDELRKWKDFEGLRWCVLHGPDKDELVDADADVFIINYDGLKWLFADGYKKFKRLQVDTLVVDESSKMKHTRTKRFRAIKPVLEKFRRRWILTGTPNPNGYLDLFGQIYILDLGKALGRYITHYRMLYFNPLDRFGWNWSLKKGADKTIQKLIAPYVMRLKAEDYIKMPKEITNIIRVELPKTARTVYDDLEDEMITVLKSGKVVTAASVGAAYTKCAQVANGGLYHMPLTMDNGTGAEQLLKKRTWELLHEEKLDAVQDLLEELNGSPALVVYEFDHDLARLRGRFAYCEKCGKWIERNASTRTCYDCGETLHEVPAIPGKNAKEDAWTIEQWNLGKLPLVFVHPASVGHGLNMQYGPGHHVIWHSMIWDFELYDQLNRRLRRSGSRHASVIIHNIVARDTVDDAKLRALRTKNRTQTGFLDALKAYAARRQ